MPWPYKPMFQGDLDSQMQLMREETQEQLRFLSQRIGALERQISTTKKKNMAEQFAADDFTFGDEDTIMSDADMHDEIVVDYPWASSSWDMTCWLCSDFTNWHTSLGVFFMHVLNIALQLTFTYIFATHLAREDISRQTIDDIWDWRVTTAHNFQFMDPITDQSLARKVCNENDAVSMSSMPAHLYLKLHKYQVATHDFFMWAAPGLTMCIFSMIVWWLTLLKEIRDVSRMLRAFFKIPMRYSNVLFTSGEGLQIESWTCLRKIWAIHIALFRLLVAMLLLYTGSQYLMFTIDMETLLLNAVALELVLNLDELIFDALAPLKCRRLIQNLAPMPVASLSDQYHLGMDCGPASTLIATTILALYYGGRLVFEVNAMIQEAEDALCGNWLDFVYVMDPGGAVVVQETAMALSKPQESYRYRAVMETILDRSTASRNVETTLTDGAAGLAWSPLSLRQRPKIPIGERISGLNPRCADLSGRNNHTLVWPSHFVAKLVQDALSRSSAAPFVVCADGVQHCNADNEAGVRMRQWCPETCDCRAPGGTLVLSGESSGCPRPCSTAQTWHDFLGRAPCEDRPVSSAEFQLYITGLKGLQASYMHNRDWYNRIGGWVQALTERGCGAHDLGNFGDLCGNNAFYLKPLLFVCPRTCSCPREVNNQPALCPTSCR